MRIEVVHKRAEPDAAVGSGEVAAQATHWARIKGDNGEIVCVTEQYTRAEAAREAIEFLSDGFGLVAAGAEGGGGLQVTDVWE